MRNPINGAGVAIAVGIVALSITSVTAVALASPRSTPANLMNLAPTLEARAGALIADANPTTTDLAQAQTETVKSLRRAPANPTAWLRLAYIDSRQPEGLGRAGIVAIGRSYAIAPYGPDDTAWRLRFALNQWTRLDTETRRLVLTELRTALVERRSTTRSLAQDVFDPAGRLALELSVHEVERLRRLNETQTRG